MRAAFVSIFLALACDAALADFSGHVVGVADGDTLTVLVDRKQVRVRLDGIDAPERGQNFGRRAQQSLAEICARKHARVVDRGKDRYGRTIGRVYCGELEASGEQVRRGMAWTFTRYVPPGSPLYSLESQARLQRAGLWADPRPIAPWDWRAAHRRRPHSG